MPRTSVIAPLASLMLAVPVLAAPAETAPEAAGAARALLVVVNRQRPESDIPLRTLVRIFRGEQRFWDDGERIYPVLPPDETADLRERFLASVIKLDSRAFALHWKNLVFRGDVTDQPISPVDERRAVQSVFSERGGLALVEGTVVKNIASVAKILTVSGRDHDAPDYALKW